MVKEYKKQLDTFDKKAKIIEEAYSNESPNLIPYSYFEDCSEEGIIQINGFTGRVVKTLSGFKMKCECSVDACSGYHYHDFDESIEDKDDILIVKGIGVIKIGYMYYIKKGLVHIVISKKKGEITAFINNPKNEI